MADLFILYSNYFILINMTVYIHIRPKTVILVYFIIVPLKNN
jgi:hypothetical protein